VAARGAAVGGAAGDAGPSAPGGAPALAVAYVHGAEDVALLADLWVFPTSAVGAAARTPSARGVPVASASAAGGVEWWLPRLAAPGATALAAGATPPLLSGGSLTTTIPGGLAISTTSIVWSAVGAPVAGIFGGAGAAALSPPPAAPDAALHSLTLEASGTSPLLRVPAGMLRPG
jgi:hypothetical protein